MTGPFPSPVRAPENGRGVLSGLRGQALRLDYIVPERANPGLVSTSITQAYDMLLFFAPEIAAA
jgi:hypothetical protein